MGKFFRCECASPVIPELGQPQLGRVAQLEAKGTPLCFNYEASLLQFVERPLRRHLADVQRLSHFPERVRQAPIIGTGSGVASGHFDVGAAGDTIERTPRFGAHHPVRQGDVAAGPSTAAG